MRNFRSLMVWTKAHKLAVDLFRAAGSFSPEHRFTLGDQVRRAALSIPADLAEGCRRNRNHSIEFARSITIAFGSACELESHLLMIRELSLIPAPLT